MSAQQKNAQVLCFGAAFRMLSDRSLPHVRRQKQILLQHPAEKILIFFQMITDHYERVKQ